MYNFVITGIAKNEDVYLSEWICFHRAIGAEKIYIYDNDSDIPIKQSMKKYIDAGWIEVIDFPGRGLQTMAYTHFIKEYGPQTKWVGIIDCDEYLVPKQCNSVPEFLEKFGFYGGLAVSWKIFGSNGHIQKPDGLTIENYTLGSTNQNVHNRHIKTICQPAKTMRAGRDPHHCIYNDGLFAVNEHHQYVRGPFSPPSQDFIQCNHYIVRSFEEYQVKLTRGRADTANLALPGRRAEEFEEFNSFPEED